jgi:hypothetical protein
VIESLVATNGLGTVKVAVDTGIELVQEVRLVGAGSVGGRAGTGVVRTGGSGGAVGAVGANSSETGSTGSTVVVEAGVGMRGTAVGSRGALGVKSFHVTNLVVGAAVVDITRGGLAVSVHTMTVAGAIKVGVNAGIGLVGKVGGVGASGGLVVSTSNTAESSTGGAVCSVSETTSVTVRVNAGIGLVGKVRGVRAGGSVVRTSEAGASGTVTRGAVRATSVQDDGVGVVGVAVGIVTAEGISAAVDAGGTAKRAVARRKAGAITVGVDTRVSLVGKVGGVGSSSGVVRASKAGAASGSVSNTTASVVTKTTAIAVRVDTGIGLIGKVRRVRAGGGVVRGSEATSGAVSSTSGTMTKSTTIAIRVDTRVGLIGKVRRVRAGGGVVCTSSTKGTSARVATTNTVGTITVRVDTRI